MASKKPKPIRKPSPPKTLRARAEEMLRTTREKIAGMPPGDLQALVHELQAHQMELDLKRMIENLPAGAVFVAEENVHMNRAAEEITGYSRDDLLTRDRWFQKLYGRKLKEARALYEENRLGGFLNCSPTTITRRDGVERIIEFAAHGFDDHEVWFLNDVTDRLRAEEALRENEERLRAILNAAADAIITINRNGVIMDVNPAAKRIFGYSENELLGKNVSLLMPSPHREKHDQYLENYRRTGEAKVIGIGREVIACRKDGSTFPADLSVSEVDHLGLYTGIVRDISERKAVEQALRHEHEFSEKIITTAQTIVLVLDHEGRVVRFNPYFAELSGWSLEEAEGRDWVTTFLPERDRKRIAALFGKSIAGNRTRGNINAILTKEGEERQIEWFDAPLTDADGQIAGLLCSGTDVTERVILEREVIEAAVEERVRTARDLHDGVGSLLTGINFHIKALERELEPGNPKQAANVATVSTLVSDAILQLRAIAKGLHPVGPDPEDLTNALRELASQVNHSPDLICQFRCGTRPLVHDPAVANHLFRIAQEAMNNAAKHSNASRITLTFAKEDNNLSLKIVDNGTGFDPRPPASGGLGLHTMEYRSRAINGSLTIRRRKEGGTEVVCVVPSSPAE